MNHQYITLSSKKFKPYLFYKQTSVIRISKKKKVVVDVKSKKKLMLYKYYRKKERNNNEINIKRRTQINL